MLNLPSFGTHDGLTPTDSIHQIITSKAELHRILNPLLSTCKYSADTSTYTESTLPPRLKYRAKYHFTVACVSSVQVPTRGLIESIDVNNSIRQFHICQDHDDIRKFGLFIQVAYPIKRTSFDGVVTRLVHAICGGRSNVTFLKLFPLSYSMSAGTVISRLNLLTGNCVQRYLLQYSKSDPASIAKVDPLNKAPFQQLTFKSPPKGGGGGDKVPCLALQLPQSVSQSTTATQEFEFPSDALLMQIIGNAQFDVHDFTQRCLKMFRSAIYLSSDETLRYLKLHGQRAEAISYLRLSNFKPLLYEIWTTTFSYAQCYFIPEQLRRLITQEHSAILFRVNYKEVWEAFTRFALGNTNVCIQPHPARVLSTYSSLLLNQDTAFEMCTYSFSQFGFNFALLGHYVAKNFLQYDQYISNNQGSICLCGKPGSGKTMLSELLHVFFDGFLLQDNAKGITEFQNSDIITKSMLRCEELPIKRFGSPEWKMTADIEASVKIRIKHRDDVQVKKYMPVVATSNSDPFDDLILPMIEDTDLQAVHRRWGFIRFTRSWVDVHPELDQYEDAAVQIHYHGVDSKKKLMISLIGAALVLGTQRMLLREQFCIPLFAHCLFKFSHTIFGQVILLNLPLFKRILLVQADLYQRSSTLDCHQNQLDNEVTFTSLCHDYLHTLISIAGSAKAESIFLSTEPLYLRCYKLQQIADFNAVLAAQGIPILSRFLLSDSVKQSPSRDLYHDLAEQMDMSLSCPEEIDLYDSQVSCSNYSSNDKSMPSRIMTPNDTSSNYDKDFPPCIFDNDSFDLPSSWEPSAVTQQQCSLINGKPFFQIENIFNTDGNIIWDNLLGVGEVS